MDAHAHAIMPLCLSCLPFLMHRPCIHTSALYFCIWFRYTRSTTHWREARDDSCPSCPSLDKHALDRSKFSLFACVPRNTLHGCLSSLQQRFWAFAWDAFFLIVQNAARYRFCNSIDVQIRLWLSYCDNTRGFQTFTINRQGLECQMSINRIQHSYNPNFSELELSKVGLTYIHLQATNHVNITILQSLKLTQPSSWLCDMRSKSMHENTKS